LGNYALIADNKIKLISKVIEKLQVSAEFYKE